MNYRIFLSLIVAFALGIHALSLTASAEEKKMDDAMMKKWMEAASPGENHKVLDYFVGEWEYTLNWQMSSKDKPQKANGKTVGKWLLEGRFLKLHAKGSSMDGKPFEGYGLLGFDNTAKKYTGIWIDNMSTSMLKSWGYYYPEGKKFVEYGSFKDPIFGKQAFRGVTTIKSDDSYTYEMFITGADGNEFRMMEITYTRKK